ncbi:putative 2-hydroxyacid dehydrogenase [Penicillium oxalicum]|uniref:putative 2-hydroxyacid dehydrogenase n=1 Tax=Penicillium oxalicum TaxID=69781 RepID=UPI0020B8E98E|nr:putative 2-hydroxyacid dehydrogenase [Penicillium oxalicum]KAI2794807.1 putative 2-hydroxyacid dehydrogenase [Penicillium oxalicum]
MELEEKKPRVLLLGSVDFAHDAWKSLNQLVEVVKPAAENRPEFIEECRRGTFDGIQVAYRDFHSLRVTGLIDQELVDVLPCSLRFIASCGAGYDQLDIDACSARNPPILVSNTPTAVDDATADVNMFLIIGALRNFNTGMHALREGKWIGQPAPPLGHDPRGKTLGILGMGGIGRNLKTKAEAFGMKVIYHNRQKLSDELARGAQYVTFDELLSTSDVISLNLPLNKNTRHIISKAEFAKMKDGVVVVNTARGAVMDEAALVEALDSGKVFSAGLDVFEHEPEIHPGLIQNRNVLLVPHMGTWTIETLTAMETWAIDNVTLAVTKGKLKSPVPEQAKLQ